MTREKVKDRTGRSTTKDLYYLGHYFFVKLEPTGLTNAISNTTRDFFFLEAHLRLDQQSVEC